MPCSSQRSVCNTGYSNTGVTQEDLPFRSHPGRPRGIHGNGCRKRKNTHKLVEVLHPSRKLHTNQLRLLNIWNATHSTCPFIMLDAEAFLQKKKGVKTRNDRKHPNQRSGLRMMRQ